MTEEKLKKAQELSRRIATLEEHQRETSDLAPTYDFEERKLMVELIDIEQYKARLVARIAFWKSEFDHL